MEHVFSDHNHLWGQYQQIVIFKDDGKTYWILSNGGISKKTLVGYAHRFSQKHGPSLVIGDNTIYAFVVTAFHPESFDQAFRALTRNPVEFFTEWGDGAKPFIRNEKTVPPRLVTRLSKEAAIVKENDQLFEVVIKNGTVHYRSEFPDGAYTALPIEAITVDKLLMDRLAGQLV